MSERHRKESHQEKMQINEKNVRDIGDIRDASYKESLREVTVRDKNTD